MSLENYKRFSLFRVNTLNSITTKRKKEDVLKDIDYTLGRIANSIQKGYTLSNQHVGDDDYRPYPYFNIAWSSINNDRDLVVRISRRVPKVCSIYTLEINEDNWYQFLMWATKWKVKKPETLSECEDNDFYQRWW